VFLFYIIAAGKLVDEIQKRDVSSSALGTALVSSNCVIAKDWKNVGIAVTFNVNGISNDINFRVGNDATNDKKTSVDEFVYIKYDIAGKTVQNFIGQQRNNAIVKKFSGFINSFYVTEDGMPDGSLSLAWLLPHVPAPAEPVLHKRGY
jgi:hypothetical protein